MANSCRVCLLAASGLLAMALPAEMPVASVSESFEGHPAAALSNGTIEITVLKQGSTIASIVLKDDPEKLSPLWNPMRMAREQGRTGSFNPGIGHFVCVD